MSVENAIALVCDRETGDRMLTFESTSNGDIVDAATGTFVGFN